LKTFLQWTMFFLLLVYSQNGYSQAKDNLDSLMRYSYLLIGASFHPNVLGGLIQIETPSLSNLRIEGFATGFFIKKNDRIFLITAYHVLTQCDVYKGIMKDSKIDHLILRYSDTLNNFQFVIIPIEDYKQLPCEIFLRKPDVYYAELTGKINDANLNSLENVLYGKKKKKRKKTEQEVIFYGYPSSGQLQYTTGQTYSWGIAPSLYRGKLADSTHDEPIYKINNIDSMYITTTPPAYGGTSGAPVFSCFRKGKREWVDLEGVQSGNNIKYDCDYIVKIEELIKLLENIK